MQIYLRNVNKKNKFHSPSIKITTARKNNDTIPNSPIFTLNFPVLWMSLGFGAKPRHAYRKQYSTLSYLKVSFFAVLFMIQFKYRHKKTQFQVVSHTNHLKLNFFAHKPETSWAGTTTAHQGDFLVGQRKHIISVDAIARVHTNFKKIKGE